MTKRETVDIFDDLADMGCLPQFAGHDLEQWAVDGADPFTVAYEHKLAADDAGQVTFPAGALTSCAVTVKLYEGGAA